MKPAAGCGRRGHGLPHLLGELGDQSIGRAKIDGTQADQSFISGAGSGSGIAIHGGYIYFTSNGGTGIGRAKVAGTDVNPNFITGLNGEISFLAVSAKGIFWADSGGVGARAVRLAGPISTEPL